MLSLFHALSYHWSFFTFMIPIIFFFIFFLSSILSMKIQSRAWHSHMYKNFSQLGWKYLSLLQSVRKKKKKKNVREGGEIKKKKK